MIHIAALWLLPAIAVAAFVGYRLGVMITEYRANRFMETNKLNDAVDKAKKP